MKNRGWVGVAVAVMLLSGCSAAGGQATGVAPPVSVEEPAPALTAEPVEATPAEEEFMTSMDNIPGLENASADTAIAAGKDACAQLEAGASPLEVLPVEGADEITNEQFVVAAVISLCPELNDSTQQVFVDRSVERNTPTS